MDVKLMSLEFLFVPEIRKYLKNWLNMGQFHIKISNDKNAL